MNMTSYVYVYTRMPISTHIYVHVLVCGSREVLGWSIDIHDIVRSHIVGPLSEIYALFVSCDCVSSEAIPYWQTLSTPTL